MLYDLLKVYAATRLVQHARLRQQRFVPALPDHVAVRLVAEDGHVAAAHQVGEAAQVVAPSPRRRSGCAASSGRSPWPAASSCRKRFDVVRGRAGTGSPAAAG